MFYICNIILCIRCVPERGEMLEFYNSTLQKARKEYACDLCNQTIRKGEIYNRHSGKYDGQMFDDKYHLTCQRIIKTYCSMMGEREYNNDSVQDWLHDTYCYDCEHYKNDDCEAFELNCPEIQKRYKQEEK